MSESNRLQAKLDSIVALYEQAIELARQEEREKCARLVEELSSKPLWDFEQWNFVQPNFAQAIRARGVK